MRAVRGRSRCGAHGVTRPTPMSEHAFGTDGQIVAVGRGELEEIGEVIVADVGVDEFFAGAVQDADIHLPGMEINSAVEFGGGCVILHTIIRYGVARPRLIRLVMRRVLLALSALLYAIKNPTGLGGE